MIKPSARPHSVVEVVPRSSVTNREVLWWHTCTVPEFRERVAAFTQSERETLLAEIKAKLAVIEAQLCAGFGGKGHAGWRQKAVLASGYYTEKKMILLGLVQAGNTGSQGEKKARFAERDRQIDLARQCHAAGDLSGAVAALIASADAFRYDKVQSPVQEPVARVPGGCEPGEMGRKP